MPLVKQPGDRIEDNLRSMIADHRLHRTKEYVQNGRRFGSHSSLAVEAAWVQSFKQWLVCFDDAALRENLDAESELDIRQIRLPYEIVQREMLIAEQKIDAIITAMKKYPRRWSALRQGIWREYLTHVDRAETDLKKQT